MKRIIFFSLLLAVSLFHFGCASTEQVARLKSQVTELNGKLDQLAEESQANKSLLEDLSTRLGSQSNLNSNANLLQSSDNKSKTVKSGTTGITGSTQCKAITKKGTQCSRNAKEGSDYCWQHQGYNGGENTQISSGSREIFTGPRGGQYYINSKGKKTYVRKKK
ncbi:MAG: hypothetical protein HF314_17525 [Ignavibacteria bacterium]|jgi:colicin import membrane protein|nr:hypothetical protein [Ignavibacteria bacterium]MCU7504887.1 hypothetical protein [Ignavibacteria bacterium]MCU7517844.1 hypothetical protein [Ignavibacteria bacterium]